MEKTSQEAPPKSRYASILINGALSLAAAAVALGLVEIGLRLFVPLRLPLVVMQEAPDLFVQSPPAGLNYALRPHFSRRAFGCQVQINSHGMRSPERPVEKPAGVRRVLILGDSVAFGHGVEQHAIFPALLETMLSDGATTGCVEVINAAVPGYNTAQEEIVLREQGMAWKPDAVLVVAVINDAEPAYELGDKGNLQWKEMPEIYREFVESYIEGKGGRAFLRRHLRLAALFDFAQPHFLTRGYLKYLDALYAGDSAGWRGVRQSLAAMNDLCKTNGIRFILVFCPLPHTPEPETLRRIRVKFAEFAEQNAIRFLDLFDAEHSRPVREVTLSTYDRHPSVLGHRLIAEALAPTVRP